MQTIPFSLARRFKSLSDFQAFHNWASTVRSDCSALMPVSLPTLHTYMLTWGLEDIFRPCTTYPSGVSSPILWKKMGSSFYSGDALSPESLQGFQEQELCPWFLIIFPIQPLHCSFLVVGPREVSDPSELASEEGSGHSKEGHWMMASEAPSSSEREGRQLAEHVTRQQARGSRARQRPSMEVLWEEWINCTSKSIWAQSRVGLTDCSPRPQNWQT